MNRNDRNSEPLVALASAGIRRDGRWLVRNVDLSVRRGEIVTLIGPNGSGKSTTAKIATGVLKPTEGGARRAAGLTVGYVPQKLAIDWTLPLTVERLMRLTGRHAPAAIAAALEEVGIPHLLRAQVQNLSGGEFQRALLARAMIGRPDLLVLDEPVQGVDFSGEVAIYDLIRRLRDRTGCGILLISHDLHVVMAETDTVICLNGHVCCSGTPESVAASPEYLKLFGARAAETLAIYRHHHDHTHLPDGRVRHVDGSVTDDCHPGDGHHPHDHTHDHHDDHGHAHGHTHAPDHDHGHTHQAGKRTDA
jgi:zinc transport system ATP-binding protein